ncbi:putative deacetylvindoline O-acetyltransferase [Helianthus annuus]|uniref:Deacetylvindoline O-acetyltransferase n=1 Tax=Helianthus annuus TaxID=4232 RepID=A0A251SVQ6_HELAN|nr:tabersonine-19-hydroxy-O-acetyltransferase [Helianthus annuus]KAF5775204.1 putative deacetylvindoline O-acetyltransferase [Helianthus annuus]KAJ0483144.1 putative deacetylvindoline O-acetyltransferase [Helianthus annuus]KAJ0499280.1 putative deacetylvindoline O-acetyltransferase [Helianthus annuus]KAJ0665300.1 putative deacetylvindoline O-acetyltransferase [Helianthus annuus]KAJ0860061.1 putative deacetylvindoline O-acetyltransferase [Helianthus annuus]
MVTIGKLLRVTRRQLHTTISRDIIKPANPTPSHLQTYNLSDIDLLADRAYMPFILFYPKNASCSLTVQDKASVLKKSLAQSLTKYHHFAGRLPTPTTPYVYCNDEGVVFHEARNDSRLDEFQFSSARDGNLENLFVDNMVCFNSPGNPNLVGVQLNHFACGGVGLAVSVSHLVADASTLGSFMNHWASVARYGSPTHKEVLPLNPHFIHVPRSNSPLSEAPVMNQQHASTRVLRKFVFPNSKLSDLKKVVASATNNIPTRVEVLSSLLFRTAVAAATTNSGRFKPSYLTMMTDVRKNFVDKLPQTTVGNFVSMMMVPAKHESETSLSMLVDGIKKQKLQLKGVQSVQQTAANIKRVRSKLGNELLEDLARVYGSSSLCGIPFNKVDFGWGKPMVDAAVAVRSLDITGFLLIDTTDGDGIEAHVLLEKEDMEIFQHNKELLSFCQVNM